MSRPASRARRWTSTRAPGPIASIAPGAAYLTPAVIDGRWMVRVSIGAIATEREDIAVLWRAMRDTAE